MEWYVRLAEPQPVPPPALTLCVRQLYKFATDAAGLFGGDDSMAMKAAGNELRGMQALLWSGVRELHFALQCIHDVMGHRIVAMPLIPIEKSTLRYGSADGGKTVLASRKLGSLARSAALALNLMPHRVGPQVLCLAGDVEGHEGRDGRAYVVDTGRTLPPWAPVWAMDGVDGVAVRQTCGFVLSGRTGAGPSLAKFPQVLWPPAHSGRRDTSTMPKRLRDSLNAAARAVDTAIATETDTLVAVASKPGDVVIHWGTPTSDGSGLRDLLPSLMSESRVSALLEAMGGKFAHGSVIIVIPGYCQTQGPLVELMRAKAVIENSTPLSPDAFTGWGAIDGFFHNSAVVAATTRLLSHNVGVAAASVDEECKSEGINTKSARMAELLHDCGLNLRIMGVVRQQCRTTAARRVLLREMLARTVRRIIEAALRRAASTASEFGIAVDQREAAAPIFGFLLGCAVEGASERDAHTFRRLALPLALAQHFRDALTEEELRLCQGEEGVLCEALLGGASDRGAAQLLARVEELTGVCVRRDDGVLRASHLEWPDRPRSKHISAELLRVEFGAARGGEDGRDVAPSGASIDQAALLYRRELSSRRAALPAKDGRIADAATDLAQVLSMSETTRAEAGDLYAEACSIRQTQVRDAPPGPARSALMSQAADALELYGQFLKEADDPHGAKRAFIGTLSYRQQANEGPAAKAAALFALAGVLADTFETATAGKLLRRCMELRLQMPESTEREALLAECLVALANVYLSQRNTDDALPLLERALNFYERPEIAAADPLSLCDARTALAQAKAGRGNFDEAVELYGAIVATLTTECGDGHPRVAGALTRLGVALEFKGDHSGALETHRRALAMYEAALGKDHQSAASCRENIEDCEFALANPGAVEAAQRRLGRGGRFDERVPDDCVADVSKVKHDAEAASGDRVVLLEVGNRHRLLACGFPSIMTRGDVKLRHNISIFVEPLSRGAAEARCAASTAGSLNLCDDVEVVDPEEVVFSRAELLLHSSFAGGPVSLLEERPPMERSEACWGMFVTVADVELAVGGVTAQVTHDHLVSFEGSGRSEIISVVLRPAETDAAGGAGGVGTAEATGAADSGSTA